MRFADFLEILGFLESYKCATVEVLVRICVMLLVMCPRCTLNLRDRKSVV